MHHRLGHRDLHANVDFQLFYVEASVLDAHCCCFCLGISKSLLPDDWLLKLVREVHLNKRGHLNFLCVDQVLVIENALQVFRTRQSLTHYFLISDPSRIAETLEYIRHGLWSCACALDRAESSRLCDFGLARVIQQS